MSKVSRRVLVVLALGALAGGRAAWGQAGTLPAKAPPTGAGELVGTANPDPSRYMFEDQIKPGMKGYGLTVMKAGKIEKFDVEVIDVIKNFGPGMNAILVRCGGLGLEHSGIIAGMSGSPVFLEDKMIGAVAFGWGSSKDPIGGVQPIRQMLNIPLPNEKAGATQAAAAAGGGGWMGASSLVAMAGRRPGWSALAASFAKRAGKRDSGMNLATGGPKANWMADERAASLRPLATPLMVSGLTGPALRMLEQSLAGTGLVAIASGAAGGGAGGAAEGGAGSGKDIGGVADVKPGEIALAPGSAIALPLLTGDMDISAVGTVTEVRGRQVWAFGHAMLAEGPTNLPIATGYIYTIMPNLVQSFKVGVSYQPAGALVMDEQNGIVGMMGLKPALVPIAVGVKTSDGQVDRTYKYQMAQHPRLSAEILGSAVMESLIAQRQLPKEFTARVAGQVTFEGMDGGSPTTLNLETMGTPDSFDMESVMLPVALLTDNPFGRLKLKSVELTAQIENVNRSTMINSVTVDKLVVAPGERVLATMEVQGYQQAPRKVEVGVTVPEDTLDGDYELVVGTSGLMLMQEAQYFPQRFSPDDTKSLTEAVAHILSYKEDRLYARLVTDVRGAAKGTTELKDLPASRVAMYASERRTDTGPLYGSVETSVAGGGVYEQGGEMFTITVDKDAGKRFHTAQRNGMTGPSMLKPPDGSVGGTTTKGKGSGDGGPEPGPGD